MISNSPPFPLFLFATRINQTIRFINYERPCATTNGIKKELSICQPVLCLVVPFRQFL